MVKSHKIGWTGNQMPFKNWTKWGIGQSYAIVGSSATLERLTTVPLAAQVWLPMSEQPMFERAVGKHSNIGRSNIGTLACSYFGTKIVPQYECCLFLLRHFGIHTLAANFWTGIAVKCLGFFAPPKWSYFWVASGKDTIQQLELFVPLE